jgi:hypothetical protein
MAADSESSGLTAISWWTVDTCQEFPLTVGATALVQKCIQAHGWSLEFTTRVLDGYKKLLTFMNMFQDYNATKFFPPLPVDKMWQQHVLDAASYEADCQLLFGRVLHRPDAAALDEETKNRRIERTLYVLRLQCKEDYDRMVWDFGRQVDTADKKKRGLRPRTNRVDWSKKLDDQTEEDTYSLRDRGSSKKRKKIDPEEERKRRWTPDGCLLPAREPKRNSNGTYNRPAGRVPFNMTWDAHRGLYVPLSEKEQAALKVENAAALKDFNGSATSSRNARKTPKKNADGTYIRPCGRVPTGMVWDENRGVFTPAKEEQPTRAAAFATPKPRKPKPVRASSSSSKKGQGKRGERTEDGCFRPASVPRVKDDGTFARPAGRGPAGMVWDAVRGLYVPHAAFGRASMSSSPKSVPCVTPTASIGSTDGGDIFNGASTHSHGTRNVRRVSADMGNEQAKG